MGKGPYNSQEELIRQAERWFKEGADDARARIAPRHDSFCTCYPWYIDGYNSVRNTKKEE